MGVKQVAKLNAQLSRPQQLASYARHRTAPHLVAVNCSQQSAAVELATATSAADAVVVVQLLSVTVCSGITETDNTASKLDCYNLQTFNSTDRSAVTHVVCLDGHDTTRKDRWGWVETPGRLQVE